MTRQAPMDDSAFMTDLADVLNVSRDELDEHTPLTDDNWDSLAHLAVIAAIDERFGVTVPAKELTACASVGALLSLVRESVRGQHRH
jgi:acyl carrier protein